MTSTLRPKGVEVSRKTWSGMASGDQIGFLIQQFIEFHDESIKPLTISRQHPQYQVKGYVAGSVRITKSLKVAFSDATSNSSKIDGAKELFRKEFKDFGEPVNGIRVKQDGKDVICNGDFEIVQRQLRRLYVYVVNGDGKLAYSTSEEDEDGDGSDDDGNGMRRCTVCRSVGEMGQKCESGSECDSEGGGHYLDPLDDSVSNSDDDDESVNTDEPLVGYCTMCGREGPQGNKCELGDGCNEDTGGYFNNSV